MEDIVGSESNDDRFTAYLAGWRTVLSRRVEQVTEELAKIDGLAAATLAGSLGRGAPWPLSDIDVILIAHAGREDQVREAIEVVRRRLIADWASEGWWTGLDAGRLLFSVDEVDRVVAGGRSPVLALDDSRWFHTMDKAFGGRALLNDAEGRAVRLATWATSTRFDPEVVRERPFRLWEEATAALGAGHRAAGDGDPLRGTLALWRAVQLIQIAMMGRWGLRDNSLGRFGSRFAAAAAERGLTDVAAELDALSDLDPESVVRRALVAPAWVSLRHDRSFHGRREIGEEIDALTDLQDTLRVCARYDAPKYTGPDFPEWLTVVTECDHLRRRLDAVGRIVDATWEPSIM